MFGYAAEPTPRIWIFNGLPGDDEHHQFFEKNLADIRKSLVVHFKIPPQNISVLYGPKEAGYDGAATRQNILSEFEKIVAYGKSASTSPVWIIFQGHANRIPGDANLNLPGPDLSATDIARALKDFPAETPLVILATTTAASDFLRALSAPGRIIISATEQLDPISETDFPEALAAILAEKGTDVDNNNDISALEIFRACQERVLKIYESGGFMVREHAQLDGNGDGKGTQRPAPEDAEPASKISLKIPKETRFD